MVNFIEKGRVTVYFGDLDVDALRAACTQLDRSLSWLVRQALREKLERMASQQPYGFSAEKQKRSEEAAEKREAANL